MNVIMMNWPKKICAEYYITIVIFKIVRWIQQRYDGFGVPSPLPPLPETDSGGQSTMSDKS